MSDVYPLTYAEALGARAQIQMLEEDHAGAERTIARYAETLEHSGINEHPARAALLQLQGMFESRVKRDHSAALRYFEQAAVMNERLFAPGHPGLLNSLEELASAYRAVGNRSAELRVRRQRADIVLANPTLDPLIQSPTLLELVVMLLQDGVYSEAEDLSRRAFLVLTPQHSADFRASAGLAWAKALMGLARYDDTEKLLSEVFELARLRPTWVKPEMVAAMFVEMYEAREAVSPRQGHSERAEAWRAWREDTDPPQR